MTSAGVAAPDLDSSRRDRRSSLISRCSFMPPDVASPWTVSSHRMGALLIALFPLVNCPRGKRIGRELRGGGRPAADIHRGQSQQHVKRNLRAVIHADRKEHTSEL